MKLLSGGADNAEPLAHAKRLIAELNETLDTCYDSLENPDAEATAEDVYQAAVTEIGDRLDEIEAALDGVGTIYQRNLEALETREADVIRRYTELAQRESAFRLQERQIPYGRVRLAEDQRTLVEMYAQRFEQLRQAWDELEGYKEGRLERDELTVTRDLGLVR